MMIPALLSSDEAALVADKGGLVVDDDNAVRSPQGPSPLRCRCRCRCRLSGDPISVPRHGPLSLLMRRCLVVSWRGGGGGGGGECLVMPHTCIIVRGSANNPAISPLYKLGWGNHSPPHGMDTNCQNLILQRRPRYIH